MKTNKRAFAAVMTAVMAAASIPHPQLTATYAAVAASDAAVKKAYSLSKKAGTYSNKIQLKLSAKNGYRIYYSKNGKLTTKKVLKSGQSKTFTIKKTTTLTLYKSKTVKTAKQLLSSEVKKASVNYVYNIKQAAAASQPTAPDTSTAASQPTAPDTASLPAQPSVPASDSSNSQTRPSVPDREPDTHPGQPSSDDKGDPDAAQNAAAAMLADANEKEVSTANAKPAAKAPAQTTAQTPVITCSHAQASVSALTDSSAVSTVTENGMCQITIKKTGTYILTGGTKNSPAQNITVSVDCNTKDAVHLVLDNLYIDNSSMGNTSSHARPVICIEKGTENADITLSGSSSLTGNGNFTNAPASAIIYAADSDAVLTLLAADASASLSVTDAVDAGTDFGGSDPSDGISAKGTLVLQSGTYTISSNGDCLKGSGNDGSGGITVTGGTYQLKSMLGSGMKSKNGTVTIYDGTINIAYTAEDGIHAKNYAVNIAGGDITIDQCNGDGIQGENVLITGSNTKLDITTVFANAGKNYYNSDLGSGKYNTLAKTNTAKTEVVNVDTGSHKGIKAGTKACTYTYRSVEDGSDLEAGKTYTDEASGGIIITGGQININTTGTGIKYNGSIKTGEKSNSGNIAPADNEGQYIIGAAEDAVHSNNTFFMSGGTLEIASADDGISAESSLVIINDSTVNITQSYEGMEGGTIIVASTSGNTPRITVYSNDDGINAASKSSVHYDYADESEAVYTKTQTAADNNVFYMLDGYLNVMIADDKTHSFSLPTEDGSTTEGSYTADGDGIDCNGSFYAYGGTVIVYGPASNGNSPIDTDGAYYIGEGVTILAAGSGGMTENPTGAAQAYITSGSTGRGMMTPGGNHGMTPADGSSMTPPNGSSMTPPDGNNNNSTAPADGSSNSITPPNGSYDGSRIPHDNQEDPSAMTKPGGQNSPISIQAGGSAAIVDSEGTIVTAFKAPKMTSYLFYSSPSLTEGGTYTISCGGSVSGTPVYSESSYDYRYTGYTADNAGTLLEVTAGK